MKLKIVFSSAAFLLSTVLICSSTQANDSVSTPSGNIVVKTAGGAANIAVRLLSPGTEPNVERLVKRVGEKIDNSFDGVGNAIKKTRFLDIRDGTVKGLGETFVNLRVDDYVHKTLDSVEGLTRGSGIAHLYPKLSQGPLSVKGYFKSRMQYENNVFYEPAPNREDVLWTYIPGVILNLPHGDRKQHQLSAIYEARFLRYTKFTQHDNIGQSFGVKSHLELTKNLYLRATEEFIQDAARPATLNTKRIEYRDQKVSPVIGYTWNEWNVETGYENFHRWFSSDVFRQFEYEQNTLSVTAYRNLAKKFRGLVEYDYAKLYYRKDVRRSGRYFQIRGGLVGELSKRTYLSTKIGFMDRRYKLKESTGFREPVAEVGLTHHLSNRTKLNFYFQRAAYESSFRDNRFFDEKRLTFGIEHLFNSKFRGRFNLSLANRDFETPAMIQDRFLLLGIPRGHIITNKRDDDLLDCEVALDYALRPWLVWTLAYKYERRDSNVSLFDYTNHVVLTELTMPF